VQKDRKMKKFSLLILMMLVASMVLVACEAATTDEGPVVSESEETTADTGQEPVEVPEEPAAEESSEMPADQAGEAEPTTAAGRVITAWVGPELVDCVGVAPQQCMQVKTNPDGEYTLFYDQIDGFDFQEGYEYEIQVLVEPVANPPADASALKYTLVEVVSQTPVTAEEVEEAEEGVMPVTEDLTLEGPTWLLESYLDIEGNLTARLPQTRVTINFAEGEVSGTAGCNNYFGPYQADGNSLTIGPLGSTMMMCIQDDTATQETAFLANLGNVASYDIVNNQLQLIDAEGNTILVFNVDESIPLVGTDWTVTGYNNGQEAVVSILADTEMTALFDENGLVSGSAGCNNYRASFETSAETINIGPAASTRKLCPEPEGIMEQETLYLAALEMAATYEIDGSRLDMYDVDGARVVQFEAVAPVGEVIDDTAESTEPPTATVEESDTAAAAGSMELSGTSWQWIQMVTPVETVTVDNPANYLVEFMPDGLISIQADCNTGSGTYEFDGSALSINITSTTLALCPEGSLSDLFIRSLNAAAIPFEQNGNLFIDQFADGGTMEFAPN
jgi:heat shock protein HslJ